MLHGQSMGRAADRDGSPNLRLRGFGRILARFGAGAGGWCGRLRTECCSEASLTKHPSPCSGATRDPPPARLRCADTGAKLGSPSTLHGGPTMKPTVTLPCLLLAVIGVSVLQARASHAVPAFARREEAKCQMCHFRLPELNEDGHSYIRRGLREEPPAMGSHSGMDMGKQGSAKPPVASTDRPLGEALPLAWQNYFTVMGHHTFEARNHVRPGIHSGTIDGWIGGPLDQRWSGVTNLAFDTEAGGVGVEQAYAQYNSSWTSRFASVRFGQLLPLAILFNGGGAAMPLSAPVVLDTPSRTRSPWAPTTLLRGLEVGMVNLPRWNAYVGAGQPQIDGLPGADHTDIYGSAEYLVGKQGDA